ncbi:MAG: FAD-binding oxidoreductase [Planctomycetes bacterium]|nr:FAD-binding oxidoreductase [Planctomycetota bacterium]
MLTATPAIQTRTPDELAAAVRQSRETATPLVDYGVAHRGVGNPPPESHTPLKQCASARGGVIEHYDRDMAIRVASAITVADLHAALRPTGQFVPIDADPDLTLGEIINHNVYGALRVGYGSIRDLLLGLRFIDGNGDDIHVGGRTVKNVAGFDMTRLLVGALGELGVVYEATLRTYAIPEQIIVVDVQLDDPTRIDNRLTDLLLASAAPTAMSIANLTGKWMVRMGYFGKPAGCLAQLRSLETFLDTIPGARIAGHGPMTLDGELDEIHARRSWRRTASSLVKLVVPPAATGKVCWELAETMTGVSIHVAAYPVHGCIFAGGDLNAHETERLGRLADELCVLHHGLRVWYNRPAGAEHLAPFAPPQDDWSLMAKLKQTIDPRWILNPGRLLTPPTEAYPR